MRGFILAVLVTALSWSANANVLTFDGDICSGSADGSGAVVACPNGLWINQSYGDTATVNVTYQADSGPTSLQRWDTGYSDLTNVAYGFFGAVSGSVTLVPLGAMQVTLNSFQIGTNPPNVSRDATVEVLDLLTNTVVFSTSFTSGGGNQVGATAVLVSPGVTSTAGLRLTVFGNLFNLGIDTVDFDVTDAPGGPAVPEPGTASLLVLSGALAAVAHRVRRRDRV